MPIKGISEIRRFSRGGKIRLGEKRMSQGGKEYPAKLDYFLFDPEDERLLPFLKQKFGDKPRRLKIAFPSEDAGVVYPQFYKLYTASGLQCKGDGETATRVVAGGSMIDLDCPGPDLCDLSIEKGSHGKPGCKRIATLQFFLVELEQLFTWQISTTSFHSIVNVNSGLELLRQIAGRISFVPIDLCLKPVTIQPDGKKQVAYVLDLVIPVGLQHLNALRPLVGPHAVASLPAPDDTIPDDLYPASQIAGPVVDADGVIEDTGEDIEPDTTPAPEPENVPEPPRRSTRKTRQEPEVTPEPRGSSVLDDLDKPPDTETAGVDFCNLPEVQALMEQRPALARAILGQAKGENWSADQVLSMVRLKLRKETS